MLGRVVGDAFVLMEFEGGGGLLEIAFFVAEALGLDFAEMVAGEPLVVQAERGQLRDQGLGD